MKSRKPTSLEDRIERWMRHENDFVNWSPPNIQASEANTLQIAQGLGEEPKDVLAACQRLEKRGVITKRGRVPYVDSGERHNNQARVGWELWNMTWKENPSEGPKTVRVVRSDGGHDDEKVLEWFGDLAVVDRIERRKHHGYKIVHAPTGMLFNRHVRTKPEAVDLARFYGSVPEGMEMLRKLLAGDQEMGKAIGSGEAFKAWQEGKKRKGPVQYKAHYWLRVKKHDPDYPPHAGKTLEENARLDTFEDALALMIGTEIQLNETTGFASLRILRRVGTKEVDVLEHYRSHKDPPWNWMIRGSNEPELHSLPMEALQPPMRLGWREELEQSVHQLPEGFEGFGEEVFKNPARSNPKGREVTPESGANLLKKLYYNRAPIPPQVLMSALDDFRPAMNAAEEVSQSSRMAKQFSERPAEIEWFKATIARLEQHPVLAFLSESQKKTFLGSVKAMKEAFDKAVPVVNPAARSRRKAGRVR